MTNISEMMLTKKLAALVTSLILLLPSCSGTPDTHKIEDNNIEALFSPEGRCADRVISELNTAKRTVVAAIYSLTSRPIAQAAADAKARGVDVRICLDGTERHEYSKEGYLKNKGVAIKLVSGKGLMHNKFCVIDGAVVITGSFNWTRRADTENDENLLIINSKEIAAKYKKKFEELWRR